MQNQDNHRLLNVFPKPDEFDKIKRLGGFKVSCFIPTYKKCLQCKKTFCVDYNGGDLFKNFCSDCIRSTDHVLLNSMATKGRERELSKMNGRIEAYIHSDSSTQNKGGVIVKISCESDFAAKTQEFIDFCKLTARLLYATNTEGPALDLVSNIMEIDPEYKSKLEELEKKLKEKIDIVTFDKLVL